MFRRNGFMYSGIEPSVPGTIRHILVVVANSISYTQTDYTVRHSKNAKFQEFKDF